MQLNIKNFAFCLEGWKLPNLAKSSDSDVNVFLESGANRCWLLVNFQEVDSTHNMSTKQVLLILFLRFGTVNSLTVISWANNFDLLYSTVSFIQMARCNRHTLNRLCKRDQKLFCKPSSTSLKRFRASVIKSLNMGTYFIIQISL